MAQYAQEPKQNHDEYCEHEVLLLPLLPPPDEEHVAVGAWQVEVEVQYAHVL